MPDLTDDDLQVMADEARAEWLADRDAENKHVCGFGYVDQHWLLFNDEREVVGCHCGFEADDSDCGWGDSVVEHLMAVPRTQTTQSDPSGVHSIPLSPEGRARRARNRS